MTRARPLRMALVLIAAFFAEDLLVVPNNAGIEHDGTASHEFNHHSGIAAAGQSVEFRGCSLKCHKPCQGNADHHSTTPEGIGQSRLVSAKHGASSGWQDKSMKSGWVKTTATTMWRSPQRCPGPCKRAPHDRSMRYHCRVADGGNHTAYWRRPGSQ